MSSWETPEGGVEVEVEVEVALPDPFRSSSLNE